jgi:hypothetical protein
MRHRAVRTLIRLALLLVALAGPVAGGAAGPRLVEDSRLTWRVQDARFGGLSGLEILDGGNTLVAVSDRAAWVTAHLQRRGGRLTGIEMTGIGPLHAISGTPLGGEDVDAEGLALDREGRAWVSFEGFHRVRRYDSLDGPAAEVPGHRAFPALQNNSGLEALAVDDRGTLYAIPERSGALTRPFPVYRLRGGKWDQRLRVPRKGSFLVVDGDFGPDGRLYLLERDFRFPLGFATRIRSFRAGPDRFDDEQMLLETGIGELDNMEGIAAWRGRDGGTRVTLISDDNFLIFQRTMVVEYLLTDE